MTNQQFGASDTAAVYDCNRGSSAAANMNREEEEKKDSCKNNGNNGHLSNGSYSPVGNGNGHSMSMTTTTGSYHIQDNPEKPPYGTTTEDIECQGPGGDNRPLTWLQKLHMVLVVISSATINGVVFGVVNNFGVFYVYLIELFKSDTSLLSLTGSDDQSMMMMPTPADSVQAENQTASSGGVDSALLQPLIAGVGSLNIGLIFFCSIFASVLSDRYGIRQVCFVGGILATIGMYASSVSVHIVYMYITYGLVLGIGASLVYAPSLAILGHYFTAKIGLVNSLVTAGSSVFSIVMPIVLRRLINAHGVQNTFKYLTGLMGVLILCSLTFKEKLPRPTGSSVARRKSAEAAGQQQHQHPHHGSRSSLASIFQFEALWKNKLYLCWLISIPTGLFGYFVPFCHLVKHAQDINSQYPGEVLVMFISIFSLIGRLCSGPLADFGKINRIALQQLSFVSIGVLTMSLTVITDFSLLLVCCGLGFFDGCFISLLGPIAFDLVGQEYGNQAIGLLLCFCSLPLTTGPPIAAYAYGLYGNYTLAFFLAGIPPIVAAVLMFNIIRLQRSSAAASAASSSHRGAFMPADNLSNGLSNGFGCGERGEKLHLLPNGNGVSTASAATTATTVSSAGDSSSPVKLRSLLSTENSSSITDETSSENASLLKASSNGNHASILPANGNSHAKQGPALVAYT